MKTLDASSVRQEDLARLEESARSMSPDSDLAFFLAALAAALRDGNDVIAGKEADLVTPSQAARLLGISRVHLYKVLDAGDLPYVQVGRDRRIELGNIRTLLAARDTASKAMAERFAHADGVRAAALESLKG